MSIALEIYRRNAAGIRSTIVEGYKVFISEDVAYFYQYREKSKRMILKYSFDVPFEKVAMLTKNSYCSIEKILAEENFFSGYFSYNFDDYTFRGTLSIKKTYAKDAEIEGYKYDEEHDMIICKTVLNNSIEQVEILALGKCYEIKNNAIINGTSTKINPIKTMINDCPLVEIIHGGINDAIMYFCELLGEDFEVKIIDRPAIRDKKGGKKRKPQGPQLFTIIRRPITTVTVDLSSTIQERPKSNEPVVHRGPLEYGHKRKPHTRTYKHPRYVNVLGHTIEINGTWVGPEKERETVYLIAKSKGE